MLDNKLTKDPNSIEEFFCVPFSKMPVEAMDSETSKFFVEAILAEQQGGVSPIDDEDDEVPFSVRMVIKSLDNRFTFKMSAPLQLFVSVIARSAGGIIMYLTYLQYRAKKLQKEELSFSDFADIFPKGFPSDKSLQDIWESQKVKRSEVNPHGSDNLLDYPKAGISIQFLEEVK
jgi:hypothetical protein